MAIPDAGAGSPEFRNRSGRLILFGALSVFLGTACCGLALFSLLLPFLGDLLPTPEGTVADLRSAVMGFLTYALTGTVLIWAGVGSLRRRRWVRPVMLTIAWTWLFVGLIGLLIALLLLDDLPYLARAEGEPWPPELLLAIQAIALGFFAVAGLFLPALFLWAYRDEQVLRTCERYDPEPGWADRCPWPVLVLSLELGLAALLALFMVLRPAVPVFGTLVTGWKGALLLLAGSAIAGYLARETYRRSMRAWQATTLLLIVVGVSAAVTFQVVDPVLLCRELGYPVSAPAGPGSPALMVRAVGVWGSLGVTLLSLVYMWTVRGQFVTALEESPASSQT